MSQLPARTRLIRFPAAAALSDEDLARHVRDALARLHDLPALETHPLAALAAGSEPSGSSRGRALRRALADALAALRDTDPRRRAAEGSAGELLRLRYEEGLDVGEVARRLTISRAEYYRRHDRGLTAVVALLRQAWGIPLPGPASSLRVAEPAPESTGMANGGTAARGARLPRALTRFIGRERELADVAAALAAGAPLLTLAGAGGCGKSRLAYELAHTLVDHYPDGLWIVGLEDLGDRQTAPARVAAALGLDERPGLSPSQRLLDHLRERRALLVLDGCERLQNVAASLVDALLRGCPSLQVLATSREPLGADGETVVRVPSLSLPPEGASTPDELLESEAVLLFVDRARAARPGFTLTEADAPAVADLCRRLDGIPLAIELAAARARALSAREIAARLDDRFALLTRNAVALPRHRTLRASIDWSHDLLSENERLLFARLAAFAGGWDMAAAEAVCGAAPLRPADILDLLSSLVDKSLVLAEPYGQDMRYRMLETLRAYALERLAATDEAEAARARHADYYVERAESDGSVLEGRDQRGWIDRLGSDSDNLRAALGWCLAAGDAQRGLRLALALRPHWVFRGDRREAREWLSRLLALPGAAEAGVLRSQVLSLAGYLAALQCDWPAVDAIAAEGTALGAALGDPMSQAWPLLHRAAAASARGDYQAAHAATVESAALYRLGLAGGSPNAAGQPLVGGLWSVLGSATAHARENGDLAAAQRHIEEMFSLPQGLRVGWGEARALEERGTMESLLDNHAAAEEHFAASLAAAAGAPRNAANTRLARGLARLRRGDHPGARADLIACLPVHHHAGEWRYVALGLEGLAALAAADGVDERARRLLAAAAALRERIGTVCPPTQVHLLEPWLAGLAARDDRPSAAAAAAALSLDQAIAEAIGEPGTA